MDVSELAHTDASQMTDSEKLDAMLVMVQTMFIGFSKMVSAASQNPMMQMFVPEDVKAQFDGGSL